MPIHPCAAFVAPVPATSLAQGFLYGTKIKAFVGFPRKPFKLFSKTFLIYHFDFAGE
jgi:hypothetical protein